MLRLAFTYLSRFFIIVLLTLAACGSNRVIVNGLDEKEANEILVFLATKGIEGTKIQAAGDSGGGNKIVLWNIGVPEARANEAMALLNQVGLPRKRGQNLLGIFGNTGLVPSGLQEKIRYQAGLGEQIANTIRKIDGVLDADVQLSFPEEDPFNPSANKQKITASVYVKHSGVLDDPNSHLVTRIRRLVAGSVPGLDFDNVTIIDDRARFHEYPMGGLFSEQERPYVEIWSLIIATESLRRFQIIFFSLILLLLFSLIGCIFLLWRIASFVDTMGGWTKVFSFSSLKGGPPPVEEKKSDEEAEKENTEPVDKGIT